VGGVGAGATAEAEPGGAAALDAAGAADGVVAGACAKAEMAMPARRGVRAIDKRSGRRAQRRDESMLEPLRYQRADAATRSST
jgi:hypothetical protein